ncbi:MAG: EcsC family protein [Phycisphaerae bacterium]|jgi:hypothetical protein|nr:EcsC family protein [Phycisphaerae bacterium]
MGSKSLSSYEREALKGIHLWKDPKITWFGQAMRFINWPLDKAGNAAMATPGIGWIIEKSVSGIVSVANDAAQWSVRPEAIYKEFRNRGHNVLKPKDILKLDLEEVDKTIGWLAARYKTAGIIEGAATGYAGMPGIPADIIALVTLNLRAIGEYATYCGFDVSAQHERLFAMNVLGLASSPNDTAKSVAMAQLVKIAREVAKKKAWKDLEKHAFVKVIQLIAKALGIRLTKAKLAQFIPKVGAVVGGGFNGYYTRKVCDAAYHLYRERLLARKYGDDDMIEVTVEPPDGLEPGYEQDIKELEPRHQD